MTPDKLAAVGRALYGERWQTALASDLQITDRSMRRWLAGDTSIPRGIDSELKDILVRHAREIDGLIEYSVDPIARAVFHHPTRALFRYDEQESLTLIHHGIAALQDIARLAEGAQRELAQYRDKETEAPVINPVFLTRVDELQLSGRCANCLKNANIEYIGELVQKTEAEFLRLPNSGRKSLNEIKEVLAQMDLHFGMKVPGWSSEKH